MFYADSHIHLQDYKTQDIKNIVTNAQKNKVALFVNASSHPSDWNIVADLAKQYPQIIPAFGVHPWYVDNTPHNWSVCLEQMLKANPRAWVGECGVDRLKNKDLAKQLSFFEPQVEIARTMDRPLIIHAVKADEILSAYFSMLPERTIFHSFTGSVEWGKKIQQYGFFIGLNFSVLRKKNSEKIIKNIDLSRILLETDGPYQSGIPQVETLPQDLPLLAEKIASIRKISVDKLMQILEDNRQLFSGEK